MKFFKKHIKIIIIAVIALLIIGGAITAIILISRNQEEVTEERNELLQRAKELVANDYLFSYIYQGNVNVTDGMIEVEGERYNYIDDEHFSEIKSISDIMELIQDTYVEERLIIYYERFDEGNKYLESDEVLYVQKREDVCNNLLEYNEDEISITEVSDEEMMINFDTQSVYAYKRNNEWFLGTNNIYCSD